MLMEMVRLLSKEEVLVEDTGNYGSNSPHDWTDRKTHDITLSEAKIMYAKWDTQAYAGVEGAARLIVVTGATTRIIATSGAVIGEDTKTIRVLFFLPAGSHTIKMQTAMWTGSSYLIIDNQRIAATKFLDLATDESSDHSNVNNGADTDILDFDVTMPSARKTSIGTIKQFTVLVMTYCYEATRVSQFYQGTDAGYVNWHVKIDDGYYPSELGQLEDKGDGTNPTYGEGICGLVVAAVDADSTVNIKVQARNRTGSSQDCFAEAYVLICPWILPSNSESLHVLDLDFPEGSTLYVRSEPFLENNTRNIMVGCQRIRDFGTECNYYVKVGGTDIQTLEHTFNLMEPDGLELWINGDLGCISCIGVDIR